MAGRLIFMVALLLLLLLVDAVTAVALSLVVWACTLLWGCRLAVVVS